ncbi:diguanylate cyclase [Motilimonas sp. 1_MG-2023]|uniref:sensor domain-containing diguanylate cyclase n=1 Tax=Motilimonas sp. 1_MG-2023 TaxID=3062672 RepID=UPI0026E11A09|nr:sensor domain-containing diguanylate cyclase [Motilimonas sp. 1_MG-2023]MDO6527867.1 diguanylate cyclase [Motilimonas sp. 1_MG-2023]
MELSERYFTVLDSLPDHVFVFSESGIYVDVYGGAENATGFDCKPFIGQSLFDIAPPEMANDFLSYITAALETNQTQTVTYKFDKQDMIDLPADVPVPQEIWFEGIIKPLPLVENGERTVVWMAKNITERHYLEQRLKELSEIDELTGVFNRRSFTSTLSNALLHDRPHQQNHSLLMVDIDRFKLINDSIGHVAGDAIIKHIVFVIQQQLSETSYIGRIGGEEFAILLSDMTLSEATKFAEQLRVKVKDTPCIAGDYIVNATISIGVTTINKDDSDIKDILHRADTAMYYSKSKGRDNVSQYSEDIERDNARSIDSISFISKLI